MSCVVLSMQETSGSIDIAPQSAESMGCQPSAQSWLEILLCCYFLHAAPFDGSPSLSKV